MLRDVTGDASGKDHLARRYEFPSGVRSPARANCARILLTICLPIPNWAASEFRERIRSPTLVDLVIAAKIRSIRVSAFGSSAIVK